MKDSIKNGIRVLFKTGISAAAGWLATKGVEVSPDFVLEAVAIAAGVANIVLNAASAFLINSSKVPDVVKRAVRFLWSPPSYDA